MLASGLYAQNSIKQKWIGSISDILSDLPKMKKCRLAFRYHRPCNRRVDKSNILSIHEKFLCDAMVSHGVLEDDCDTFIESTYYMPTVLNILDPHVEVTIQYEQRGLLPIDLSDNVTLDALE